MKLQKTIHRIIVLSLIGIATTLFAEKAAFAYAILGLLMLTAIQAKVVKRDKSDWRFFGGNPFSKLDEGESEVAALALAILLSVVLTFFAKLAWLSSRLG